MDDFVIIGAGAAGEAAAHEVRRNGASVTVERELLGGSCPFWACMPSKTLLHAAGIHAIGDYPWPRASARRDYMISREGRDWPDDGGHTTTRDLPASLVILGGGPTGVELGQVFARYGVPVTSSTRTNG